MRSTLMRRLKAIEEKVGSRRNLHPMDMTDQELWEALDIRDPVTGALRTDVPDEEIEEMYQRSRANLAMVAGGGASSGRAKDFIGPVRSDPAIERP